MTHELDRIEHYVGGDTLHLEFEITEDGESKDLTDAEFEWWIKHRNDVILNLDSDGINLVVTDTENGEFRIEIERGITQNLSFGHRTYEEFLRIIDSNDNQRTYNAEFYIEET